MAELPLIKRMHPTSVDEVATLLREAHDSATPVYPLGGDTSRHWGLPAKSPGMGVQLTELKRVIDYPARDLTITVEAGITMTELSDLLARERQQLPFDVPHAARATLGGVIATNWNSPRRYGCGHVRDYVIGIEAVDGRGQVFHGGGRVVKNVAGYDFCKLLTGSLGVLGIITQLTLKLRPTPECISYLGVTLPTADDAETWSASLMQGSATPAGFILTNLPQSSLGSTTARPDKYWGLVRLEGTELEVSWMQRELDRQWAAHGWRRAAGEDDLSTWWERFISFPAEDSPLTLQIHVRPSGVMPLCETLRQLDTRVRLVSHAGSGVVFAQWSEFPAAGLTRTVVGKLQPLAREYQGRVTVLANPSGQEATLQSYFGGEASVLPLLQAVKRQFDPAGILNPGRFLV